MPFARQPRTLRNKDALPTVQTADALATAHTLLERRSHSRRYVKDALPYLCCCSYMGKQRVHTSARMPIFDARLLRELHAQAATVNVSLEGQRAPATVLARDQTLQRSKLAAASSLRAGCSSSAYMLMQ